MQAEGNKKPRNRYDDNRQNEEEEIKSEILNVENKRYYVDIKRNRRGKFVKIAEVFINGFKSKIFFPMSITPDILENLNKFYKMAESDSTETEASNGGGSQQTGTTTLIKSFNIIKEYRRYYLDLRENSRGKFVQMAMVRERPWDGQNRTHVTISIKGLKDLLNVLQSFVNDYMEKGDELENQLPKSKSFSAMGKVFYVDVTANFRGVFMIVSELQPGFRTSILIGVRIWQRFIEILEKLDADTPKTMNSANTDGDGANEGEEGNRNAPLNLCAPFSVMADRKKFYFDCGSNPRGIFLRISEVKTNYRTAITLPRETWSSLAEIINSMWRQVQSVESGDNESPISAPEQINVKEEIN